MIPQEIINLLSQVYRGPNEGMYKAWIECNDNPPLEALGINPDLAIINLINIINNI